MYYFANSSSVSPSPKGHLHTGGFILAVTCEHGHLALDYLATICIDDSCLYFHSPDAVDLQEKHEKLLVTSACKGGG